MDISSVEVKKAASCEASLSCLDVAKLLRNEKERHVIVTKSGKPVGIISTTDINNRLVAEGKDAKRTMAEEIMTSDIIVKDVSESIVKAYLEMVQKNVVFCVVVKNDKLEGTLGMKEAMNHMAKVAANSLKIEKNKY